jgi:hypothetical protein
VAEVESRLTERLGEAKLRRLLALLEELNVPRSEPRCASRP